MGQIYIQIVSSISVFKKASVDCPLYVLEMAGKYNNKALQNKTKQKT